MTCCSTCGWDERPFLVTWRVGFGRWLEQAASSAGARRPGVPILLLDGGGGMQKQCGRTSVARWRFDIAHEAGC